ncbi:MAG: leucine-rich repeat domain-containing protein, partial [Clostridia bacterium]|nr:leucine-rich repeat domain-containing protein [Clostridia bacterium]
MICAMLKKIILPEFLTTLGNYVFAGCTNLSNITFPPQLSVIPEEAFRGCTSLNNVEITDSICIIGNNAFNNCTKLSNIYFDNAISLIQIGAGAFSGCSVLAEILLPDNLQSIGSAAFSGCVNLASITLPFIGASSDLELSPHFGYIFGAAQYDGAIEVVQVLNGITQIYYIPEKMRTVNLIASEIIGEGAFSGCTMLSGITIPTSVNRICKDAFSGLLCLRSITINSTTPPIMELNALPNDINTVILVPDDMIPVYFSTQAASWYDYRNKIYSLSSVINSYCIEDNVLIKYVGNNNTLTLPTNVTSIKDYAFYNFRDLISINIPNTIISIGKYCFASDEVIDMM